MNDHLKIKSLMLIDDSDIDQMIYKRIVERSGMVDELLQFTNAEAALETLAERRGDLPTLILLDINMPMMNGFEFLDAYEAEFENDASPVVVMLTTSLNPRDRERAASFDCVADFLNKPLSVDMLTALAKFLSGQAGPPSQLDT